ncbi:MAG: pyridoxamine 5'-phosphate oxidase family protein [Planctomycetales bacterium]|nr:pyridoxamine 5'-phosphate oxidase family protein [Planctomycetales bacterium]
MGQQYEQLTEEQITFITRQQIYFVGTAGGSGRINVSPKGMNTFRIISPNRVAWLNVTGSGNETAAHLLQMSRMTIMFCAFQDAPLILRLYGRARAIHPRDEEWSEWLRPFQALDKSST